METPFPLLPFPDGTISLPEGLTGEERLHEAYVQALDHLSFNSMAWPAKDAQGRLVPPPDDHVLHELAHDFDLATDDELLRHPRVRTVGFVDELMDCDLCGQPARYDAHIKTPSGSTIGAYLCNGHYLERGSGTLGPSSDAYLMPWAEISQRTREICNQIRRDQGKEPALPEPNG